MSETKQVHIKAETHERLSALAKKNGQSIQFLAEQCIQVGLDTLDPFEETILKDDPKEANDE